jgi:hypothetical protein
MRTSLILILLPLLTLLFTSCDKQEDFSLSQTIFIEDPYYPSLPIYSEWGYNTFGAYIDRKPFISTDEDLPAKIIVNTDTMNIILRGRMQGEEVVLKFSVKGYSPQTNYDLTQLDKTVIDLESAGNSITMKIGNSGTLKLRIIEGELNFSRVQRLLVDEEPMRIIMSGYFSFKTFLDGEPVAISYGRFDLGIGYENFYNY